jgi:hypothetical protein
MAEVDMLKLLGELSQIVQHLWCQFTTSVRSDVNLNDRIEEMVNLLEHFDTFLLVLLYCL